MTDATDLSFQELVLDRSSQVPVIVDFWAPWCQPCRSLGPVLERVVDEKAGKVELVKVNVDENPRIAASFSVQSIPAVYALVNGAVVDGFIGVISPASIEEFIDGVLESAAGENTEPADDSNSEPPSGDAGEQANPTIEPANPATEQANAVTEPANPATETVDVEARLESLLGEVKQNDDARRQFLEILESLDEDDPRKATFRRRLSAALF